MTHEVDPYEVDPYEVDPFKEREATRADAPLSLPVENFSEPTEPETEPETVAPSLSAPGDHNPPTSQKYTGGDQNSAAAVPQNFEFSSVQLADARMRTGHKWPQLVQAGLGYVWIGPKWADFLPELVEACARHLKEKNLPSAPHKARDYVKNCIRREDWAALELRLEEMDEYLQRQQQGRQACEIQPAAASPSLVEIEQNRANRLQALWDEGNQRKVGDLLKSHPEWGLSVQNNRVVGGQRHA